MAKASKREIDEAFDSFRLRIAVGVFAVLYAVYVFTSDVLGSVEWVLAGLLTGSVLAILIRSGRAFELRREIWIGYGLAGSSLIGDQVRTLLDRPWWQEFPIDWGISATWAVALIVFYRRFLSQRSGVSE